MEKREVRLIDANALEKALEETSISIAAIKVKMFRLIEKAPTIAPETLRPQWISVEDRLPPSGPALIVTIYNKVHCKKELRYPVYYYQSENGDCDFFHFAKVPQVLLKEYSKVLAWMPLPQIYEGLED